MAFLIGLLTFAMIVDCLILVLLVLIQLPKKEAGVGVAFGGAATDALFGAGSGNVLTKATKYAGGAFFGLALVLSLLQVHYHNRASSKFQRELQQPQNQPVSSAAAPAPQQNVAAATSSVPTAAAATNTLLIPAPAATNTTPLLVPAKTPATGTNAAAPK